MLFITGPLYSGKRTFAAQFGGRQIYEVQDRAAEMAGLQALADELAAYDVVTATEVGGGIVPIPPRGCGPSGLPAGGPGRLRCADVLRVAYDFERRTAEMLIYLLRHGLTEYNAQKRYQGQRDIPLSEEGCRELRRADIDPKVVYISTLQRTAQTARVLFPNAKLIPVDGLKEMCFGSFEGRSYVEMEHDPDYLAWVASNCERRCPDGERKDQFCERICTTFAALVDQALAEGEQMLVILAHGGTQMAALDRYAVPHRDYYEWCAPNAGGFVLDARDWKTQHILHLVKTVQYTKEATC